MTTPAVFKQRHVSHKASLFTESVIREMTREAMKYGAVNLSQGFPDFAAPNDVKRVAMQAIAELQLGVNVIGVMALVENMPSGTAMKLATGAMSRMRSKLSFS